MSHKRLPEVRTAHIDDLRIEEFREHDPHGMRLIMQDLRGKIATGLTRVDVRKIVRGFYRWEAGRAEHYTQLSERGVTAMQDYIRGGGRPSVEIYWSSISPPNGSYVCSDSEVIYEAYVRLGFTNVPVRILKPNTRRQKESVIWVQPSNSLLRIVKTVESLQSGDVELYRLPGGNVKIKIKFLIDLSANAAEAVQQFHADHQSGFHYHQMLNAVSRRHARFLDSINQMIEQGRMEHAALIARACYESYLNFHLDWLAPQVIGPRLQLLAASWVGNIDIRRSGELSNFIDVLENVRNKARLSSLGLAFYDKFYPAMSKMVHQSYIYVEREGSHFREVPDEMDSVESLVNCLNVITAAMLKRILNDVGK